MMRIFKRSLWKVVRGSPTRWSPRGPKHFLARNGLWHEVHEFSAGLSFCVLEAVLHKDKLQIEQAVFRNSPRI